MKSIYGPLNLVMVRPLPKSFLNALKKNAPKIPIDWELANQQHDRYVEVLRECGTEVLTVPVDEQYPDCCFIEDTALVSGDTVVISRIGAATRLGESEAVYEAMKNSPLKVLRLQAPATFDGGDVLQMGDHIFVGLSERTNQAAVEQLAQMLPGRKVHAVKVVDGLHLKSVLSAMSDDMLVAAETEAGQIMAGEIMDILGEEAECALVPDVAAANVVRINETVVIQAGFPASEGILRGLAAELDLKVVALNMSELIKADGALTCCSLLIP